MGTTSEKLTYLNGTKQLLKDKINNLGGSIDDNTTFRQYANQLQGVYDNLPKTEYQEGTEITLSNTLKGKLDYENGVVGIGQTEQDGTPAPDNEVPIQCVTGNQDVVVSGKNYLPNVETQTNVGVTTDYTNAVISINGTSTGSASVSMQEETLQAGTYTMCSKYISGSVNNAVQYIFKKKGASSNIGSFVWNDTNYQNNQKNTFTLDETTIIETSLWIGGASRIYTNFKTNVQLVKGSERDDTYEPYITPTSYQLSLGDIELAKIGTYQDYIFKNNDKWYVHKAVGKHQFTGEEELTKTTTTYNISKATYLSEFDLPSGTTNYLLNKYVVVSSPSTLKGQSRVGASNILFDYSHSTDDTTAFRTSLATTILYAPLATATDTEITDTSLINQLEDIYNMQSVNGTTIITSNGNLPMIIKVRGLKGE